MTHKHPLPPTLVIDHLAEVRAALVTLLRSLTPEEWEQPTRCCPGWSVKDLAAHMLADDVGILSRQRDHYQQNVQLDLSQWENLVAFINQNNAVWVEATRRLSPRLLVELLSDTGDQLVEFFRSLDPFRPWTVISWASDDIAPVWMEIAREYTEYWLHQQQIRETVGQPGLTDPHFLAPLLDIFMRALPRTFRHIEADENTHVQVVIPGEGGNSWSLVREAQGWSLYRSVELPVTAQVTLNADTTWRLFTKGMTPEAAAEHTTFAGDEILGRVVLQTVAIIA